MAIKVNGTTVINDSRQLQNVASLDATTVAAIGAAGVGGLTATETQYSAAFSNAAGSTIAWQASPILGSSVPSSSNVFASKTISSGVSLASISVVTGSGMTHYAQSYYGSTVGIAYWNGSELKLLVKAHEPNDLSNTLSQQASWIENKNISSGLLYVSPGDIFYGLILATYDNVGFVGGSAWSAGTVTTTILELS